MPHRFFLTRLLVFVPILGLLAGCGGGAATGDLDKIEVTLSQFEVSVTNISGRVLTDVVAEIVPAGPASHFVAYAGRMGSGESRSLAHTSFTDRDSLPFSARSCRAKSVMVKAKEMDGTAVQVEVPFRS